jgi:hypothetical protein
MKRYSDLPATDALLPITMILEPVGLPLVRVSINDTKFDNATLEKSIVITDFCRLLDPVAISVSLENKHYTLDYETAVIVRSLSIDNIEIIPKYNHLIDYQNDHNINPKTNYLGYNGKWTLTIDRPFYQWLHQVSGQGWLLT